MSYEQKFNEQYSSDILTREQLEKAIFDSWVENQPDDHYPIYDDPDRIEWLKKEISEALDTKSMRKLIYVASNNDIGSDGSPTWILIKSLDHYMKSGPGRV